ncbi:hypothetical protein VYU27_008712 [Nannochloropsis oceanica]
MDYLSGPRKGSGGAGANDLNSPGLVFRGRGGTPRAASDPNGFEVQVDLETPQTAAGMGGSNKVGPGRTSAGSGASAGVPYMHQQGMAPPEWQTQTANEHNVVAPPRRGSSLSASASAYENDKNKKTRPSFSSSSSSSASALNGGSTLKSLLAGACLTCCFFGILFTVGFFDGNKTNSSAHVYGRPRSTSSVSSSSSPLSMTDLPVGSKRSLRGSVTNSVITSEGTRILQTAVDHHHSRVIFVPAREPFSRRNIHHFAKHGEAVGMGGHRNETDNVRAIHVDDMEEFVEERREYVRHPDDVLMRREDYVDHDVELDELLEEVKLPFPFISTGGSHKVVTAHGIDDHHDAEAHDYFGSSMTNMGKNAKTGLTTIAVGAPGALDTSGIVYFVEVNAEGEVEDYTYLTHEDFEEAVNEEMRGRRQGKNGGWGPNTALGWALENVGDLDGDGVNDLAVGALGYPGGSSKGAVFIFFLTEDHGIKSHTVITQDMGGFPHTLNEHWRFGSSLTRLGDLDGDGVTELADQFGSAVRGIGDLDGDGIPDMVVSGDGFPSGEGFGAVWVLFLNIDGSVKYWRRLDEMDMALEAEALFGASIANMGDLNGDGLPELLVGAPGMHELSGEAYIISLNKDGKIQHFKALTEDDHELDELVNTNDEFGWSVASLGDLDGDGIPDLAVAAETSPSHTNVPSIHMIYLAPQDMGAKEAAAQDPRRRLR